MSKFLNRIFKGYSEDKNDLFDRFLVLARLDRPENGFVKSA